MRRWLLLVLLLLPPGAAAQSFDAVHGAAAGAPRQEAAEKLIAAPGATIDELGARLAAPRTSTDEQRREVLARFGADVPTPDGKFKPPPPPPRGKKDAPPPPQPDWLKELAAMDASEPAVRESLEIVVVLRALAATNDARAATIILDFAFTPDGVTFRDECGRQVRAMSPWSLPALITASQDKKSHGGSYGRYATYQLERLDKTRPSYALGAAPEAALEIEILRVLGETKHPDAIPPVLDRCDSGSPGIRRAAREAWMKYVTGPPPPPAPKAKRKLQGGKMSDEEMPLYLTYRELADQELRRRLTELGVTPGKRDKPDKLTEQLFALWDQRRLASYDEGMNAALALAGEKKWAEAAAAFDAILVAEPLYGRRAEMAPAFFEHGKVLAAAGAWDEALLAFEKAYSLDPSGALARQASAEVHFARAKVLEAKGKPAADELEQALAADPNHPGAKVAATEVKRSEAKARRGWMLWAGAGGGVLALVLLALGLRKK
jgi:tetratricopeptide (TPR) repeat protein